MGLSLFIWLFFFGEMVNTKIITFSVYRMIEVDYVKISFEKVNPLKSYKSRPKHPPELYLFLNMLVITQVTSGIMEALFCFTR